MMVPITVLMTVYNAKEYLAQSIASVLAQSYADFEFLIINDGSRDDSLAIIRSFHDPRIVVRDNEANIGQTRSLNIGFELAKGEYVARIDADDIAFPHWLESQAGFLEKNAAIDVLSAGLVVFNEKGLGRAYIVPSRRDDILLRAIIRSPINHGGALMKKSTILKIGGYNNEYRIAADYGVWTKLIRQGGCIVSNPDVVMSIRRHEDSESERNRLTRTLAEIVEISRHHIEFLTGMELSEAQGLLLCRAHYDAGGLDYKQFLQAVKIHRDIYAHLKPELDLDQRRVEFWHKDQAKTFFLKRIYGYILARDQNEVRAAAREALLRLGFSVDLAGLYFFSFFPQLLLDRVSRAYHFFHRTKAKILLAKRSFFSRAHVQ